MQPPRPETVTLNDILITEELSRRSRSVSEGESPCAANLQAENQALHTLARQLVAQPENILKSLVDIALDLCVAGTAGVSLLETTANGEEIFRWNVLAGALAEYVGGTTPRNFSPCGTCLDRGTPQLYQYPERYFTYLQAANTPIVEGLVVPLIADNQALGTIWIVSHNEQRHFDSEDVRVMTSLADFTAAALLLNQRQTQELLAKNAQLEAEVVERKRAEELAQENEAYFRAIANLVPDLLWRNCSQGKAIWYNQSWFDYTGQTWEEAQGNGWIDVIHPDDRAQSDANFQNAVRECRLWRQEHRIRGRDGNYRWFLVQVRPVESNGRIVWFGAATDIHEQRMALESLRISEERLRLASEAANFGVYEYIPQTQKLTWSPLLKAMHGLPENAEITPDLVHEFVHPNDRAQFLSGIAQLFSPDSPELYEHEFRIVRTDGEVRWLLDKGRIFFTGEHRRVERVIGVTYDISDRQQSEATLRESEKHLKLSLEASLAGSWSWDVANNTSTWDDRFHKIYGFAPDAPRSYETWLNGVHPDDRTRVQELTAQLFASIDNDFWNQEFRLLHPSQGERWVIATGRVERDATGRVVRFYGLNFDISDRKRAEEQLRLAAEMDAFRVKLSDALRSLSDAVEIQGIVTRTTMNFFRTDRCYYCEIIDGDIIIRRDAAREDLPTVVGVYPLENSPIFKAMLDAGQPFAIEDVHTTDMLGENLRQACFQLQIISFILVPVIKQGEPVGILSINQTTPRNWTAFEVDLAEEIADRTWATIERTRAEANLREAELQRVREQSAREQERQRAESLAELDRTKTLFFSNISHEFRTPLTLSLAPLQDALSDRTHPLAPVHREQLELVHRNSLRLLKLVNTLLDFSRIEAGRMEAVYEPTDLAMFTTELASVFRSAIERARLRLIVDCPPLPEPVYVDREMWEKIVLNLLSNAFKYTFEGEIAVRLHPALAGDRVILEIEDTGTGIAAEHLPHLFERFYQVRGVQARTYEGSGIGLALVRELIRLHNGTIDVRSIVGQGSCFAIAIPFGTEHLPSDRLRSDVGDRITTTRTPASTALSAAPYVEEAQRWLPQEAGEQRSKGAEESVEVRSSVSETRSSSSESPPALPARILLVDDNADMRDYLTRILSDRFQVEAVADGAAALAAATERVPDLVLSDVMMPGLDGFELLRALRADPRTREIPIILLSARAGEESVVEGLEAGADDYLIKPFSAQELVSRVNGHLQMAQLRYESLDQERTLNRRKDELLSTVSHELNTPLVAILGWTRLLRANPSNQSMLIKSLETIERNALLQAKLIQDLLDISRITAGKLRLNLAPVELESAIEIAIATVTQTAQAKGINLNWRRVTDLPDANSVVVMGDRDRLQQLLCNLLTNGIKFTPESGSVTVELSRIEGEKSYDDCYAEVRVTDTGIGISAEFLPYIFDRFRQAEQSVSAKGLGLGLAIARHLVELHNGTIHAQSAGVGQGSTFIVRLPLLEQDQTK